MGAPIDLVVLDGTWRLQYTSAPDVLILLEAAARLPFFQVPTLKSCHRIPLPLLIECISCLDFVPIHF